MIVALRPLVIFLLGVIALSHAQEEPRPEEGGKPAARERVDSDVRARTRVKRLPNGDMTIGKLHLHAATRQISFPATFQEGSTVLEAIIVTPTGRLHEALLKADISPLQLQFMLYLLNLNNGARLKTDAGKRGALVDIDVEWRNPAGQLVLEPVENWVQDDRTKKPMKRMGWVFTGSVVKNGRFLAAEEGNICINYSVGSTILDSPDPQSLDDTILFLNEDHKRPPPDTEVRVVLSPRGEKQ